MEARTVNGRELVTFGIVAGRPIYQLMSGGETYRLTPDTGAAYVLRRESVGYIGAFETLEAAGAYVATLEQPED